MDHTNKWFSYGNTSIYRVKPRSNVRWIARLAKAWRTLPRARTLSFRTWWWVPGSKSEWLRRTWCGLETWMRLPEFFKGDPDEAKMTWLVVWNISIFPYIGNNHPNWLSYFSEGLKPPTSDSLWWTINISMIWIYLNHLQMVRFWRLRWMNRGNIRSIISK